jgi:hypothetical protein
VVGEARRHRRQARGPRLRVAPAAAAAAVTLALACAYAGDPPGGPPDTTPPRVLQVVPESGAVLTTPPRRVEIDFDEVISEQIAASPRDIQGAVLLSPVPGKVTVDWRRTRLTIAPKGGFKPGRIYRLELLPVITDLRQNRMRQGKLVVFSTGPAIPDATLRGTVVDWVGGHAAPAALVEAVLLPDSLPYRALADSSGDFTMRAMPAGDYLVYGVVDQNGNRRRDPREAFDTARVTLQDSAAVELYAFAHDTVGPRLRSVELADSLTLRLTFDRPLDPTQAPDTARVHVAPAEDTAQRVVVTEVLTPAGYDSLIKAVAAARDSAQRRAAPAGPAAPAAAAPGAPPAAAAPMARAPAPPPLRGRAVARPDTTRAARLLARRPPPTDRRLVRLATPLHPGARYQVDVSGARGLTGVEGHGRASLLVAKAAPPRTTPRADSLQRAGPRADTLRAVPGADTLRAPARPDTLPTRPESTPPPRDSIPARTDSTRPASPPPAPPR